MAKINQNDILIFIPNCIFLISLIPSILSSDKPNVWTSLMQIALVPFYIQAYRNLKFKLAFYMNILIGLLWIILFFQKV